MENLNKQNFFDAITKKYPGAMIKFHQWIDAYKKSVDWEKIFITPATYSYNKRFNLKMPETIKFHDLTYEMQLGILIRFVAEVIDDDQVTEQVIKVDEMRVILEGCFQELQSKIKPSVEDMQEKDLKDIKRNGQANNN
jgi:hypothetical protein